VITMKTGYTSDWHLEHDNIIDHCERPFANGRVMSEVLIENINKKFGYDDILYHLGDMYMPTPRSYRLREVEDLYYWLDQIHPTVIPLLGNHDSRKNIKTGVEEMIVRIGKRTRVFMSHYPQTVMPINLCGHVHDTWRINYVNNMFCINVGVDMWNYEPIEWTQIQQIMQNHRDFYTGKGGDMRPILNERLWRTRAEQRDE
jgi:calcineurin-like phosphoesterase family protein